jgi:hypothetical protein
MSNVFPRITQLINAQAIPEQFRNIVGSSIEQLLGDTCYTDLFVNVSREGDAGFYSLLLLLNEPIGFEISGTNGLAIRLNPPVTPIDGFQTALPITVNYDIEMLRYITGLKIQNFAEFPLFFLECLLKLHRPVTSRC